MTFDPVETAPRERLEALELERLRQTVGRVLDVPARAEQLRAAGVGSPAEIESLDDLQRVPFTEKDDLRAAYPLGLHAVAPEQLARVHVSTGSGGRATIVGYTTEDIEIWTQVMARCLAIAGVRPGMVVHLALKYGLLTGGIGFQQGAERLGAPVVPAGVGDPQGEALLLRDLRAQVLCSTPSYALLVAEAAREAGAGPLNLQLGLFGAEPWSEAMRATLERELGLVARNIYGLSEIIGPGVSVECGRSPGWLHLQEDHFLPEIVEPGSGRPLAPGQEGELVLTTLTKAALPLLRYRTGDITALDPGRCACGRTLTRMAAVRGRRTDQLSIGADALYPSDVEQLLLGVPGIAPHWQLAIDRDDVVLRCEPADPAGDSDALLSRVRRALAEGGGAALRVELVEPGTIPRSRGKAVRVVQVR